MDTVKEFENTLDEIAIQTSEEIIRILQDRMEIMVKQYYVQFYHQNSHRPPGSKSGSIGITRRKYRDRKYFYWAVFNRNNYLAHDERRINFCRVFKKGGKRKFAYNTDIICKNSPEWERRLVERYEKQFSIMRAALAKQRKILRAQKLANSDLHDILVELEPHFRQ